MEKGEIAFLILVGVPLLSLSLALVVELLCYLAKEIKDTIDYCKK